VNTGLTILVRQLLCVTTATTFAPGAITRYLDWW
jgi:hypothetical protein